MKFNLNKEQSKGLANFFLDLGKGFFLACLGIAAVSNEKIPITIVGILFTTICVFEALYLLGRIE